MAEKKKKIEEIFEKRLGKASLKELLEIRERFLLERFVSDDQNNS